MQSVQTLHGHHSTYEMYAPHIIHYWDTQWDLTCSAMLARYAPTEIVLCQQMAFLTLNPVAIQHQFDPCTYTNQRQALDPCTTPNGPLAYAPESHLQCFAHRARDSRVPTPQTDGVLRTVHLVQTPRLH